MHRGALITSSQLVGALYTSSFLEPIPAQPIERLYRPESFPTVARAGEGSRGLCLFPYSARAAYVWLLVAAALGIHVAQSDANGGIRGRLAPRSYRRVFRHHGGCDRPERIARVQRNATALQQKADVPFVVRLNLGCLLRVTADIPAYEANLSPA